MRRSRIVLAIGLLALVVTAIPGSAAPGFVTEQDPMLALGPDAPRGSKLTALISSGDEFLGFMFEGIPDGIGFRPVGGRKIDVYVTHEQSHVPFGGLADFVDSSISRLTVDTRTRTILDASVALPPTEGFLRFCSAFMAGPAEGFDRFVFFANEETDDDVPVPPGALYGPDPAIAPNREGGYAVYLDTESGVYDTIPGMGRHNHENTVVVPGGWDEVVALSGDDTFNAPSSQLYQYSAATANDLLADAGHLLAFRVTATQAGPVDPTDPFNGANDYGDIVVGDDWEGEFIPVPDDVADGTTALSPQAGLESWSNENNVFQFIRVEDIAYDEHQPNVVYFADTGERRATPNPATGRLMRGPSTNPDGSQFRGPYPNGRIFRMELDPADPSRVVSFSILLNNDLGGYDNPNVMHQPDNIDTSFKSLMVQEDSGQAPNSRIWRYDFASAAWTVVASVLDAAWESSGIVDASRAFGPGSWLVDVQAHNVFVDQDTTTIPGVTLKREGGQLLLLRIPGS
ncbi:MAG: alkaline phosphatase PhoX [Actinomycetota bacterium]